MSIQSEPSVKADMKARQVAVSGRSDFKISRVWMAAALIVFLLLSVFLAYRRAPWNDEGWFASASLTLLHRGYLGTAVIEPTGTHLPAPPLGLDRYTYWVLPGYLLFQTVWFAVVGFGPFLMRLTSVFWGLGALFALHVIAERLFADKAVARLCVCLLAIDTLYINGAALARMDMMAAALAFLAIALFLSIRERNLTVALFGGSLLASLACFTHHQAILGVFALGLIAFHLDGPRLRWKPIALALVPWLLLMAAWALYAFKQPSYFVAQLATNGSGRLGGYREPLEAVKAEIFRRYGFYGYSPGSQPLRRVLIFVPALYLGALAAVLSFPSLRRRPKLNLVARILCIQVFFQIFFEGNKLHLYLVHVVPWFTLLIAALTVEFWTRRHHMRWAATALMIAFCLLQIGTTVIVIVRNNYPLRILPIQRYLLTQIGHNQIVCGSPELGLYFGFQNLVDDLRLGYYGVRKPSVIVLDDRYRGFIASFKNAEPIVYEHIQKLLSTSELVLRANGYDVYKVTPSSTYAVMPPVPNCPRVLAPRISPKVLSRREETFAAYPERANTSATASSAKAKCSPRTLFCKMATLIPSSPDAVDVPCTNE